MASPFPPVWLNQRLPIRPCYHTFDFLQQHAVRGWMGKAFFKGSLLGTGGREAARSEIHERFNSRGGTKKVTAFRWQAQCFGCLDFLVFPRACQIFPARSRTTGFESQPATKNSRSASRFAVAIRAYGVSFSILPDFTRTQPGQSFPEEWRSELDMSILEGNDIFRECFMLHRATKSVFAMDSLVEMGEDNIPHPILQAGFKMAGNFGRVSFAFPPPSRPANIFELLYILFSL